MRTKYTSRRSDAAQATKYTWLAAVTVIAALILGAFIVAPPVLAAKVAVDGGVQKGIDADAARYQALGEATLSAAILRGIDADSARYQGIGESFLVKAGDDVLAANPELISARIFNPSQYAGSSLFALNPELMVARSAYSAPASLLASNPELMVARSAYSAPASLLASNPELMVARSAYSTPDEGTMACSLEKGDATLAANPELVLLAWSQGC
jgi:hypothetical protein